MAYLLLIAAFSLNAAANILLKLGAGKGLTLSGPLFALIASNWQFILGLVLFAANALFYFFALRSVPLSLAYPVMVVMSFLIINGYAIFAIGETVTPLQIAGYVLIVAGISFVVLNAR